ncbi:fungal-specific transcription factor domain-containing protein [Coniochaeta sp. 2T2.1]|nr:fungal-specific transcription factor domain-containing protein [Coniochaeta sp. 2T2.1]
MVPGETLNLLLCNGLKPCSTCIKRRLTCIYTGPHGASQFFPHGSPEASNKRRQIEATPPESHTALPEHTAFPMDVDSDSHACGSHPAGEITPPWDDPKPRIQVSLLQAQRGQRSSISASRPTVSFLSAYDHPRKTDNDIETQSRHSTISGPDEEADVFKMNRMLKDSAGRLLYLGDSATLSYLQLIRNCVELAAGTSPFTHDPSRHQIMEVNVSLPPDIRPPHLLLPPDPATGRVLAESFFINTMGLVDVFDKQEFMASVESCYTDPLHVDTCTLCLLYLVFAIGLVLANPASDTEEFKIVERMRGEKKTDWAEMFYRSAKLLGDPVSGFEDADLWSVKALVLMSVYTLAISKRNAAYAYYGMAVRSAFALGLHRKESLPPIPVSQRDIRRNLWKTLVVLDRFLSASLGRPTAINEDDCSESLLDPSEPPLDPGTDEARDLIVHVEGLNAVVRSSQAIGTILKRVYSKRKVTTALAQGIVDKSRHWSAKLHPDLHWKRAYKPLTAGHGIALLHANLFQGHTTILLTRPFFLFMIHKTQAARMSGEPASSVRVRSKLEKFSSACVEVSNNSILLVQRAYQDNHLSQRNPFVLYFLFAASLIILSNEFFGLFNVEVYETRIENAIAIMRYCAETDPQANRLLYILTEFRAVVAEKGQSPRRDSLNTAPKISSTPSSTFDPMANLTGVYDTLSRSTSAYDVPSMSEPKLSNLTRHNSLASMAVPALSEASSSHSSVLGVGSSKLDMQQQLSGTTPPQSSHHSTSLSSQNVNEYYSRPNLSTPNPAATLQTPTDPIGDGSEIDFDSFWHWSLNGMSGTGAPMGASGSGIPVVPASNGFTNAMGGPSFPAFSLNPAGQNGMGGLNGNIHMYPPSNFV